LIHFIWLTQPGSRAFSFITPWRCWRLPPITSTPSSCGANEVPKNNFNWLMVKDLFEVRPIEAPTEIGGVRIAPDGVTVANPAFDVTPHRYITGIVTENGIAIRHSM
jgi:hypothetical protein